MTMRLRVMGVAQASNGREHLTGGGTEHDWCGRLSRVHLVARMLCGGAGERINAGRR